MPLWQVRIKVGIPGSEIGSGKHKEPEGISSHPGREREHIRPKVGCSLRARPWQGMYLVSWRNGFLGQFKG